MAPAINRAQLKVESTRDLLLAARERAFDSFFGQLFFGTLTGRPHTLERANTAKPRMPSTSTEGCDEISCPWTWCHGDRQCR